VVCSILSDYEIGTNLSFFRLFRIFRVIRVARMFRFASYFHQLRRMMLSIMASITSLMWAGAFLGLINFIFSIFFLNAAVEHIKNNNFDNDVRDTFTFWYKSMPRTMYSLLIAITGGTDWVQIMGPVENISWAYQAVFTFYVIFVVVGVLNVLTGVFLESAADIHDRDLIVQGEIDSLDGFVEEMLGLFNEFMGDEDGCHDGQLTWEAFQSYIRHEHVEAYLSSHMLDTSHAYLLYKMLDYDNTGTVSLNEFVLGMLRLKGAAKTYDARVLLHQIDKLRCSMTTVEQQISSLCDNSKHSI